MFLRKKPQTYTVHIWGQEKIKLSDALKKTSSSVTIRTDSFLIRHTNQDQSTHFIVYNLVGLNNKIINLEANKADIVLLLPHKHSPLEQLKQTVNNANYSEKSRCYIVKSPTMSIPEATFPVLDTSLLENPTSANYENFLNSLGTHYQDEKNKIELKKKMDVSLLKFFNTIPHFPGAVIEIVQNYVAIEHK